MINKQADVTIDPDGTLEFGLLLIVKAPTGVRYQSQSGGAATIQRSEEGYLIPVGSPADAVPFQVFFREHFGTYSPNQGGSWDPGLLEALQSRLQTVRVWVRNGIGDKPFALALDHERLSDLTEAWIPVLGAFGKGILVFKNSD